MFLVNQYQSVAKTQYLNSLFLLHAIKNVYYF